MTACSIKDAQIGSSLTGISLHNTRNRHVIVGERDCCHGARLHNVYIAQTLNRT